MPIRNGHVWVAGNLSIPFPSNAVHAGWVEDGTKIYVGRVNTTQKGFIPARITAENGTAFAAFNLTNNTYYIDGHVWVAGNLSIPFPSNAIHAGYMTDGTNIYVGRYNITGLGVLPAAIVVENGTAFIGHDWHGVSDGHVWVAGNLSIPFPSNAVQAGWVEDGTKIYVGRVNATEKGFLPARIIAENGTALYGYVLNNAYAFGEKLKTPSIVVFLYNSLLYR
ncbi:uncharacterized protein Dwil_GK16750 [Drosophila willistoni]|uniref:Uncharacterized protein n=1 Tax=Drosophila willistoni TaxID=7260 RepID=A0A0Q9WZW7_DROWI|nr:uncharacterized protein Dwil_GK16750 [Drosophila willistoni]